MKRIVCFVTIFTMALSITSAGLFANPKINKAHAPLKSKDGKAINCGYCHGSFAKKKDQQYLRGQAKYKEIAKFPSCTGARCHK